MNALCTFCFLVCLLIVYAEAKEFSYNDLDTATQNELDRLIGEALNRQSKGNPNKQEYEKFYNVRKFMMQRVQKSEEPKTTVKTTTVDPLISTTHRFFNKNWWFNRHSDHPLVSPDDDEDTVKDSERAGHDARAHLNSRSRTFVSFPHLKHARSWQDKSDE